MRFLISRSGLPDTAPRRNEASAPRMSQVGIFPAFAGTETSVTVVVAQALQVFASRRACQSGGTWCPRDTIVI